MNTNVIRIVAAIVDARSLTLYKEDGSTETIQQGDLRLRKIIEQATPLLMSQGYADVDIAKPIEENQYANFEQKSSGLVKFFRVAKEKLKNLFKEEEPVAPKFLGSVPVLKGELSKTLSAIGEIMLHAVPASSPDFHEVGVAQQGNVVEEDGSTNSQKEEVCEATDTIVAVVDNKIIPGMEKIKTQFTRANKLGSTEGVDLFLLRLAQVIGKRSHSVEDLLKFMERADLPIADDGSIIIYKVLKRNGNGADGKYVDYHTKRVGQWTGAYVCMDEKLVDHNRNNECSNGLHVARRGYIREFSGDVCVLAKLAPEDVIAVPSYDANKMRVCGYHILFELSNQQYACLKQNRPITEDPEGKKLLALAISGQHIDKTHEVRITGSMGTDIKVTKLTQVSESKPLTEPVAELEALANPDAEAKDAPIDPNAVVKQVEQIQLSRKDQATALYAVYQNCDDFPTARAEALDAVRAFKKQCKVGWDKLGLPDLSEGSKAVVKAKGKTKPKAKDKLLGNRPELVVLDDVVEYQGSPRQRIEKMLAIGLNMLTAQSIVKIKKQAKKSWSALGVTDKQVAQIMKLVGD